MDAWTGPNRVRLTRRPVFTGASSPFLLTATPDVSNGRVSGVRRRGQNGGVFSKIWSKCRTTSAVMTLTRCGPCVANTRPSWTKRSAGQHVRMFPQPSMSQCADRALFAQINPHGPAFSPDSWCGGAPYNVTSCSAGCMVCANETEMCSGLCPVACDRLLLVWAGAPDHTMVSSIKQRCATT